MVANGGGAVCVGCGSGTIFDVGVVFERRVHIGQVVEVAFSGTFFYLCIYDVCVSVSRVYIWNKRSCC